MEDGALAERRVVERNTVAYDKTENKKTQAFYHEANKSDHHNYFSRSFRT